MKPRRSRSTTPTSSTNSPAEEVCGKERTVWGVNDWFNGCRVKAIRASAKTTDMASNMCDKRAQCLFTLYWDLAGRCSLHWKTPACPTLFWYTNTVRLCIIFGFESEGNGGLPNVMPILKYSWIWCCTCFAFKTNGKKSHPIPTCFRPNRKKTESPTLFQHTNKVRLGGSFWVSKRMKRTQANIMPVLNTVDLFRYRNEVRV